MKKIATTDEWANINYAVEQSDIVEHYDIFTPDILRRIANKVYGRSVGFNPFV